MQQKASRASGESVPWGRGVRGQWPNTVANQSAHANEEPLNPPELPDESALRRLTGIQRLSREETAAPEPKRPPRTRSGISPKSRTSTAEETDRRRFFLFPFLTTSFSPPLTLGRSFHRHVRCFGSEPAVLRVVLGSGAALGLDSGGERPHPRPGELPHSVRAAAADRTGKKKRQLPTHVHTPACF